MRKNKGLFGKGLTLIPLNQLTKPFQQIVKNRNEDTVEFPCFIRPWFAAL